MYVVHTETDKQFLTDGHLYSLMFYIAIETHWYLLSVFIETYCLHVHVH